MNRERVSIIMADIEKYLREFEDLGVKTMDDLKEKKNFYSSSMVLLTIFNRVIDLGQEIVLSRRLGVPATYSEIFALLEKAGLISGRLSSDLREMVRIRNRLSHEYFAFGEEDVLGGMKIVASVKEFIKRLGK